MDAREVALLTLFACEKQGAWSDGYLKKTIREARLDPRDGALATRLCAGVLQNRMLIDFYLDHFSTVKLSKMETKVLLSLRLGVYQMLFLDRVPVSAAVNTSVELARTYSKNPRSAALVNGILRGISRHLEHLPEPKGGTAEHLSIRYSHPRWLVDAFLERLGPEEGEALLRADNEPSPIYAQVNSLRTTGAKLSERWTGEGVDWQAHPWLPGCFLLSGTGDLEKLPSFREGLFTVQDPAARLAVLAAGAKPGMQVLDVCAAPGGKSFAAAQAINDMGEILSCDIHPHKQVLIEKGAERLGITCITTQIQDGKHFCPAWEEGFDLVIADVPCSGLGVIRKKPDIRYKDPAPLEGLPKIQQAILENVSRYVKPGGTLLYSTCTLLRRENEDIVSAFLEKHNTFTTEQFQLPMPDGVVPNGMLTLWPQRHGTDGFFIAKLRKRDRT